jgi:hypothetical protein
MKMQSSAPINAAPRPIAVGVSGPPPLELVAGPTVDTAAAAAYLNRRPQTLRSWACHGSGPIRPIRIYGRLAWPVAQLRKVLGVAK